MEAAEKAYKMLREEGAELPLAVQAEPSMINGKEEPIYKFVCNYETACIILGFLQKHFGAEPDPRCVQPEYFNNE